VICVTAVSLERAPRNLRPALYPQYPPKIPHPADFVSVAKLICSIASGPEHKASAISETDLSVLNPDAAHTCLNQGQLSIPKD
jgi:hypothetical protein